MFPQAMIGIGNVGTAAIILRTIVLNTSFRKREIGLMKGPKTDVFVGS
jgi:hypothetical protein